LDRDAEGGSGVADDDRRDIILTTLEARLEEKFSHTYALLISNKL
jgi:hypothetical protein